MRSDTNLEIQLTQGIQAAPAFSEEVINGPQNSLGHGHGKFPTGANIQDTGSESVNFIPLGPALPPGKSMKITTNYFRKTKLKILNQNIRPATVAIDGIVQLVSAAKDFSPGTLDLTAAWKFGKTYTITNQSDWILRIEY